MKESKNIAVFLLCTALMVGCAKESTESELGNNGEQNRTSAEEWVDLGLSSGLLWASCNIGATTPEDYGNYYAWGETVPKDVYDWSTYLYCYGGDNHQLIKYCADASYGFGGYTDTRIVLEAVDDAATAFYGSGYCTPTVEDWTELFQCTVQDWTIRNNIGGLKFTAANGNSIFLPAAGSVVNTEHRNVGQHGRYWTSMYRTQFVDNAWGLYFYPGDARIIGIGMNRSNGFSVRAVRRL